MKYFMAGHYSSHESVSRQSLESKETAMARVLFYYLFILAAMTFYGGQV